MTLTSEHVRPLFILSALGSSASLDAIFFNVASSDAATGGDATVSGDRNCCLLYDTLPRDDSVTT